MRPRSTELLARLLAGSGNFASLPLLAAVLLRVFLLGWDVWGGVGVRPSCAVSPESVPGGFTWSLLVCLLISLTLDLPFLCLILLLTELWVSAVGGWIAAACSELLMPVQLQRKGPGSFPFG